MIAGSIWLAIAGYVWWKRPDLGSIGMDSLVIALGLFIGVYFILDSVGEWRPRWRCAVCGKKNRAPNPGDIRLCLYCLTEPER